MLLQYIGPIYSTTQNCLNDATKQNISILLYIMANKDR